MTETPTQPATRFTAGREDGKSNQQVVIELVCEAAPGTQFTFGRLADALAAGTSRTFDRRDVQQVVRLANHRLLREHRRCLRSVRGVGYAVAHANDHRELAGARNRRGTRQFKWALETLENVRLDEMTEEQRKIHLAQLEINSRLMEQQRRILRRQTQQDRVIASLTSRVEQIEARTEQA